MATRSKSSSTAWFAMRRITVEVVRRLPVSWLLALRDGYLDATPSSLGRRWRRAVLDVVRLRGIPQTGPFEVPGAPGVRLMPSDSYVAGKVFWLGMDAYEPGGPEWWADLVRRHCSILELGANIGLYAVVGALAAGDERYRAVEPNRDTSAVLRANLALNGLEGVEVIEAAVVGPPRGPTVALRFPDRDPYAASAGAFVDGAIDLHAPATRAHPVPAVTAGDVISGADLLKLDIEGMEHEVLSSARPWIVETAPTLVVEIRDDAVRLRRFLRDLARDVGYESAVVCGTSRHRISPEEATAGRLQVDHGTRDVTFARPRLLAALLGPAQ